MPKKKSVFSDEGKDEIVIKQIIFHIIVTEEAEPRYTEGIIGLDDEQKTFWKKHLITASEGRQYKVTEGSKLMDDYFRSMPERFDMRISDSYDAWEAIISSFVFVIHDKQLNKVVNDFFKSWYDITTLGLNYYETSNNHGDYQFHPLKGDVIIDPNAEDCFNQIINILPKMLKNYLAMTAYIKSEFPGIDLEDTSRKFEVKHSKI